MARLDTPAHSDDDFDLLYDAESVSDVSDGRDLSSSSAPDSSVRYGSVASSQRISGPHEVPIMPVAASAAQLEDDVPEMSERVHSPSVPDYNSSSSGVQRRPATTRGRGNMMSDGLQYTKSMYNRMWNKDALIAVMGSATSQFHY